MQQRPTNAEAFELHSCKKSQGEVLPCALPWAANRYTSAPRTVQLLWMRKGLPAFYRGCAGLHREQTLCCHCDALVRLYGIAHVVAQCHRSETLSKATRRHFGADVADRSSSYGLLLDLRVPLQRKHFRSQCCACCRVQLSCTSL